MTPQAAALLLAAGVAALAAGWAAPGRPPEPVSVTRFAQGQPSQVLPRPDEASAEALGDLADKLEGAEPAAAGPDEGGDPAPPPGPAPPPEPDIALVFRSQVSAIINRGPDGLAVVLREQAVDGGRSRLLRVGDSFEGGWRLAGLTMDEAVLRRGREEKRAPLYGSADGG